MDWESWRPQDDIIATVKRVLEDALVPNNEVQKQLQERLKVLQNYPDFSCYLFYIMKNRNYVDEMRSLSGILLKNYIATVYKDLSQDTIVKLRQECLMLLRDPCRDVRTSIANVIYIIGKDNLSNWPELVPFLVDSFEALDVYSEVALNTLFNICEYLLNINNEHRQHTSTNNTADDYVICIVKQIFPNFVDYLANDNCTTEKPNIIKLINRILQDFYIDLKQSIDLSNYLVNVIKLANSNDVNMQKLVCHTFVMYLEYREDSLVPHLHDVIMFLLLKTQHDDLDVALAACEFWLAATKMSNCKEILSPYISLILPILLKNMKYSTYEIIALNDDNNIDQSKDVYPFRLHDRKVDNNKMADLDDIIDDKTDNDNDDDDNDDLDDMGTTTGGTGLDDYYVGWTLRKCSAASLDALTIQFGDEILPVLIQLLNTMMVDDNYLVKESAVLALGAISEGCMNGLKPHLPYLLDYLLQSMNNDQSMIRVITCWTLSRYSCWIIHVDSTQNYFIPVMTVLLRHFVDVNKRVQGAAISAFCVFQEEAQTKLIPHIELILEAFKMGFEKFHYKNLYLLYDAVGVLAQSVGERLNKKEYIEKLIPSIIRKLNEYDSYSDDQFIAVLECLAVIIPSFGVGFLPYSEIIYYQCLEIITNTLMAATNYQVNYNEYDPPDKEAMNVALDVLYSMAIGLKSHFNKFIVNSNLVGLLYTTIQDCSILIKQTSIALYGELVMLSYPHLSTTISEYIPLIVKNLDENFEGVCNNAAWVIGKLCTIMGANIQPYLNEIVTALVNILNIRVANRAMYQTVSVSLCLICYICPDAITTITNNNNADNVVKNCCISIRNLQDSSEKDVASRGLCEIIARNPDFHRDHLIYFCEAIATWNIVYVDLRDIIRKILITFKDQYGDYNWLQFATQLSEPLKMKLHNLYGV